LDPKNKAYRVHRIATQEEIDGFTETKHKKEAEADELEEADEADMEYTMDVDPPEAGPSTLKAPSSLFVGTSIGPTSYSSLRSRKLKILFIPDPTRKGKPHSVSGDLAWVVAPLKKAEYDSIKGLEGWVFYLSNNSAQGTINVKIQEWVSTIIATFQLDLMDSGF
jgi:hypothetical protein